MSGLGKLTIIVLLTFLCGCASHIHNPSDQAASEKAEEQFKSLLKSQQEVFGAMKANLDKMSELEVQAYREMADRSKELYARQVTRMTWKELRDQLDSTDYESKIAEIRKSIEKDLVSAKIKRDQTKSTQQKIEAELKKAKETLTSWNMRVAVLEKLIELTPEFEALSQAKGFDGLREKSKEIANKAKDEEVTYINADAKPETKKLKEVFQSVFKDVGGDGDPDMKTYEGISKVFKADAPGLVVTIASLAKDLADAERARADAHVQSLQQRMDVLRRAEKSVEVARNLLIVAKNQIQKKRKIQIQNQSIVIFEDGHNITVDLKTWSEWSIEDLKALSEWLMEKKSSDPNFELEPDFDPLMAGMLAINNYVAVKGPLESRIEEALREDAYLRHLYSIEASRLNAAQHEALVSRGLESLLIYHSGGVKPQEIAEIAFDIANLLAFTAIAIGVN